MGAMTSKFYQPVLPKIFHAAVVISIAVAAANSQVSTGGPYAIEQSVTAGGGGRSSTSAYVVDGSLGQPAAAGISSGGVYSAKGGFWRSTALTPTAAMVTISGRVLMSADGRGLRSALVTLTDQTGAIRQVMTGAMGTYRFEEVESGQTYVIAVRSRRFTFAPQVVSVNDNVTDFDIIGEQ